MLLLQPCRATLLGLLSLAQLSQGQNCTLLARACTQTQAQLFASSGKNLGGLPLASPVALGFALQALLDVGVQMDELESYSVDPSRQLQLLSLRPTEEQALRAMVLDVFYTRDTGNYESCAAQKASHWCTITSLGLIRVGQCLPDACSVVEYVQHLGCQPTGGDPLGLAEAARSGLLSRATSSFAYCEELATQLTFGADSIAVLFFELLLVMLTLAATAWVCVGRKPWAGIGAFDMHGNIASLVRTRGAAGGDLVFLNGVRTLSTFSIVLGHTFSTLAGAASNFTPTILALYRDFVVLVVARIELSVDTFFWMSGFIAAFIMSKRLLPDPRIDTDAPGAALKTFMHSTTQSVVAIVHRFLRLTPLYAFVLFFYIYLLPFTGSGPVWRDAQLSVDMDYCRNHWFLNIFYVSNFAGDPNHRGTESCMQWSWYLAVDFQFFFITAFLMPYYQRFPKLVIAAFVIALAGSIGANMQLSSQYNFGAAGNEPAPSDRNAAAQEYTFPHTRSGSYVIGVLFGLYYAERLHQDKSRPKASAAEDRTSLVVEAATENDEVPAASKLHLAIWLLSPVLLFIVYFLPWLDGYDSGVLLPERSKWSTGVRVYWNGFDRAWWALGVTGVAHFCIVAPRCIGSPVVTGLASYVTGFLSLRAWEVLAKLSYGAYLWHLIGLELIVFTRTAWPVFSVGNAFLLYAPALLGAYVAAYATFLIVEKPFINLENVVKDQLKARREAAKKSRQADDHTNSNGNVELAQPLDAPHSSGMKAGAALSREL